MRSYNGALYELMNELKHLYDAREATAIANAAMEHITGLGKLQRVVEKDRPFIEKEEALFESSKAALLDGRPLQYVIGIAWFMGKPYKVNEQVLIPRSETEELVQWIIDDHKKANSLSILDVGTGSGCIPISLKLGLPGAILTSCDISTGALTVAKGNADKLKAPVTFMQLDILNEGQWALVEGFDVIVSNPPYIPLSEKEHLHTNVKDHEPAMALFVPDEDALVFYKAIAQFGKTHLNEGGIIYCELQSSLAGQTKEVFEKAGYTQTILKQDMHGNMRMIKAIL